MQILFVKEMKHSRYNWDPIPPLLQGRSSCTAVERRFLTWGELSHLGVYIVTCLHEFLCNRECCFVGFWFDGNVSWWMYRCVAWFCSHPALFLSSALVDPNRCCFIWTALECAICKWLLLIFPFSFRGNMSCWPFFDIVNDMATNILICVFLCKGFSSVWPEDELLGHRGWAFVSFPPSLSLLVHRTIHWFTTISHYWLLCGPLGLCVLSLSLF